MSDATRQDVTLVETLIAILSEDFTSVNFPFLTTQVLSFAINYSYDVATEPESGHNLNPPVIFTRQDEPFRLKLFTTDTTLHPTRTINVFATTLFNEGLIEGQGIIETARTNGSIIIGNQIDLNFSGWSLEDDGTYSLTVEILFDTEYDKFPGSSDNHPSTLYEKTRNVKWDGFMGFLIGVSDDLVITNVTLSGFSVPWNTGWDGHSAHRGRPVEDQKTGLPVFAQDCQEDGWYHGLWTMPETWDPEEHRNLQPVELPSTEGELDDDFPA